MRIPLWRRKQGEQLDAEVRAHLEAAVRERVERGASRAEAEAAARREFGNVALVKETTRDTWGWASLDRFVQDLRFGWRNLRRRPGFTAAAVLTLALGIASTTAVFSAIHSLLLRPLPFDEPSRLALVWGTNLKDGQPRDVISGSNFLDLQRSCRACQGLAAFHLNDMPARLEDGVGVVGQMEVTPEFFSVLGARPALGRAFEAADGLPARNQVALISHGFWQQRFGGDPRIIGKTLQPLGQPHTIIGVLPPGFLFFTAPDVVTPLVPSDLEKEERTHYHYWVLARLRPGATHEQAEAELDGAMARLGREFPPLRNWEVTVEPLQPALAGPVRPALLALLSAAGVLLLIGCANVASLLLARGLDRRWEFAVRAALGAGRGRLVRQLLTESAVLALLGGAAGALAAGFLVPEMARLLPETVALSDSAALVALPPVRVDGWVFLFSALLAGATVLIFGLWPARRAARAQPQDALRAGAPQATSAPGQVRAQRALLLAQTALATLLLVTAGLMLRTVQELLRADPGFRPRNSVAMYVGPVEELNPAQRAAYYESVVRSVQRVPGVTAAGLNDYILLQNEDDYKGFVLEGQPLVQASVRREEWRRISPDYFRAMGIPLLGGRPFNEGDNAAAPSVAIVNQAFARKYWPGQDPVGRRILITTKSFRWSEIVGLVGDERTVGVNLPAKPMLYAPFHRDPRPLMALFVRTEADPRAQLRAIQQAAWAVDPARPIFSTVLLETLVSDSISVQRLTVWVAAALAGAALALTAIGIFGVMNYTAARRTNEFGIRIALGAQPRDLRALVLREGLATAAAGVFLGASAALVLARALTGMLYGVSPADPLTFAAAGALLLAVALLACWLPARRAARLDPVTALRHM